MLCCFDWGSGVQLPDVMMALLIRISPAGERVSIFL